ncbi:MAG: metal-dependent hydrolase [Haloarculaceae archaeon]
MFVGHGLLAFALVALLGRSAGWPRDRTLALAVTAGAFATLPDVDILYAPVGLLGGASGIADAAHAFWETGNVVHRAVTHSLLVGAVAAAAYGLWSVRFGDRSHRPLVRHGTSGLAAVGLLGLVATATVVSGLLGGVIMTVFTLVGLAIATGAARRGLGPRAVAATALFGICTHPFGDLFTGSPPQFLYPLDLTLFPARVALNPDPTLNLLGAFFVELACIWLAAYAGFALFDRRLGEHVSPRAALGLGYAAAVVALPPPSLASSAPFVFSVLALGTVGPVRTTRLGDAEGALARLRRRPAVDDAHTAVVTGLAAVTIGAVSYGLAYLLL